MAHHQPWHPNQLDGGGADLHSILSGINNQNNNNNSNNNMGGGGGPPPGGDDHKKDSGTADTAATFPASSDTEGSYPLPSFLKFCPGGITFAAPQQQQQQRTPSSTTADATTAATDQGNVSTPAASATSSLSSFWYQLSTPSVAVQAELRKTLIQEAQTADDRLRKYTLLYHSQQQQQQQQQQDGTPSGSSMSDRPPLVMPSMSVLCEAAFGRLTGVPPEFVKEWADAMVLASLDEDEKRELELMQQQQQQQQKQHGTEPTASAAPPGAISLPAVEAAAEEQPPESEDDIWNAKPKAVPPTLSSGVQSESSSGSSVSPNSSFGTSFSSPASSLSLAYRLKDRLAKTSAQVSAPRQRRPCGYVFCRGDIAWNCRTCQTDATCVICDDCFRNSNHEGHEVYFHRTSPGGCCDCGDIEAWKIQGCCSEHRPESPLAGEEDDIIEEEDLEGEMVDDGDDEDFMQETNSEDLKMGASMSEDSLEKGSNSGGRKQQAKSTKVSSKSKQARRGGGGNSNMVFRQQGDPLEAVRTARKGQELQVETLTQAPTALPPKTTAALATVVGAAVGCLVQAVNGAGVGADPIQFKPVWAQEATQIALGYTWPEEAYHHPNDNHNQPNAQQNSPLPRPIQSFDFINGRKFPKGYQLHLRLHNDDVHTFDEVIEALHESRPFRRGNEHHPGNNSNNPGPMVPLREQAAEMTQHVDADGQVTVMVYDNCVAALQGYRRLKSRGLHCAVVSTAQIQLEQRARQLAAWLTELSSAHPVVAALCVHALVQVDPNRHRLAGYHVWSEAHLIPAWAGSYNSNSGEEEDEVLTCRRRFQAFPPHWESSYCTRFEAFKLHGLVRSMSGFVEMTWADAQFYSHPSLQGLLRRLSLERYLKSPHALWGTLPALYHDATPPADLHPLVRRLALLADPNANNNNNNLQPWEKQPNRLTESVFVVDTDLRKQQEAERVSCSVYPHKLPGLHLLLNPNSNELPNPMEMRHLLAISSYRAPVSSILVLLLLDPYPTKQLRGATHALFLSLLTDSRFKCRFAGAFGVTYRPLSTLFCAGVGTEADTPLHFSVQILTAGSLVRALGHAQATERLLVSDDYEASHHSTPMHNNNNTLGVFCMPIAHTIARCIHTNLLGATKEVNMILTNTFSVNDEDEEDDGQQSTNSNDTLLPALTYVAGEHPLLTLLPAAPDDGFLDSRSTRHKRLPHLIRDLEYVIETPGTALRLLLFSKFPVYQGPVPLSLRDGTSGANDVLVFPTVFARLLRLAQGMDPQKRKISGGHVEYEQNRWLEAFGLSLNVASARDALAESPAKTDADVETIAAFREAMGNLNAALLREIKLWLYREGLLETGLPIPSGGGLHGPMDLAQAEALQRSTLHVSGSHGGASDHMDSSTSNSTSTGMMGGMSNSGILTSGQHQHHLFHHHPNNNQNMVALSCATGVKMTEHQLGLIENALKAEGVMRYHRLSAMGMASPGSGDQRFLSPSSAGPSAGLVMGDWLRVPHSPLAGDSLSFHLPLHRALAKSVRSLCSVIMPDTVREASPTSWWKIPVLDDDSSSFQQSSSSSSPYAASFPTHPLVPLLKNTLRSSNCRVVWMLGPDCTPQEAQRRRARARNVSAHIAVTKVLHSLADHPIRCLAAAQQIERHLWARNGTPVAGMAMNYTSTPLCRAFRDLDLLLVQLSATGWNVGLGARRVFALLLSRFNMDGYLCDPERRSTGGSGATAGGTSSSNSAVAAAAASMMHHHPHHRPGGMAGLPNQNTYLWVNPPRLQDPDHAVVLSESFFATLCVLVTELPPPPPRSASDNSALRQSIRRELLHALASEPRSRSEAMTAAALGVTRRDESEGSSNNGGAAAAGGASGGGLFRATFAQVLDEIGQARKTPSRSRTTPGGPPTFELSADCCEEYDPTFFHLRRQEHQHAMDIVARLRKQKYPNDCLPLVCPPPKAHPRFLPCRLLLHLPALDASIRRALLFALTGGSWLPPPEPVVPEEEPKTPNKDEEDDDDDIILHDGLVAPANFSMTASGDVVITSFSTGHSSLRSLGSRLTSNRPGLLSSGGTAPSYFRRHQTDSMDPLLRSGKPFSREVVVASAISFLEVLQLLTLQAHTLEECASLHRTLPDLDEESRLISSGLSINTYLNRLVWVPESLEDVWALRPSSQGGPLDSKGTGERRGSILGLLIALYEHRADHSGGFSGGGSTGDESDESGAGMDEGHHGGARHLAAHGLKWLLRFVRALVDGAISVSAAAKSATSGVPIAAPYSSSPNTGGNSSSSPSGGKKPAADSSSKLPYAPASASAGWTIDEGVRRTIQGMLDNLPDLWPQEKRNTKHAALDSNADTTTMSASKRNKEAGKEAQRRVMEMMMQKQRTFAATIEDSNDIAENAGSAVGDEECIICRCDDADGEINGPLGYLGHVQRSRVSQMRSVLEAELAGAEHENSNDSSHRETLMKTFRVIGHMGCQLRETEALDSKPLTCLPRGSVVTVLKRAYSAEYGILSRRVLVRHVKKPNRKGKTAEQKDDEAPVMSEGWASIMSSQGYVILSPLVFLCYSNSKWGATRPILKQCGHAAHLKCVETHTLSLHQRAAGEQPYDGRFAANIADGEFLCPLCKQLSNILIPRDTATSTAGRTASDMDVDNESTADASTTPLPSPLKVRGIDQLLHIPRLTQQNEEDLLDLRVKALEEFGSHLYQAMEVSWDRTLNNRKKQQKWHPAIRRWDYEEEVSSSGVGSMGLPRLLRQQLISWAAVGHSASAAEAGARGVEEVLPFGISSQTSDPWNGFSQASFKTHAMLRELKRTFSGSSGLLEALCVKMTNRLGALEEKGGEEVATGEDKTPVILRCLADLLEGRSWVVSLSQPSPGSANEFLVWTQVTALNTALPCHVARDGVLSLRCEARAAAASMWATKGGSGSSTSSGTSSHNPTLPLAVRHVQSSTVPALRMPDEWGSLKPCSPFSSNTLDDVMKPFRLGIACGYMYTPLLAWDLNTFSAAIFSALLLQDVSCLPDNEELLRIVRILICARIVQAISLPGGFELPDLDDLDDEDCWTTDDEINEQGSSLAVLWAHCRTAISKQSLDPSMVFTGNTATAPPSLQLLAGVGRAILPFARSLILMLRAIVAVCQDRQERTSVQNNLGKADAAEILHKIMLDPNLMRCEDGFTIVKAMRGPLPTDLASGSGEWLGRVNRWLVSLIGFEMHQGSSGRNLLPMIAGKTDGNETEESLQKQAPAEPSRQANESGGSSEGQSQEATSHASGDHVMAEAPPVANNEVGDNNTNQGGFVVVRRGPHVELMVDDLGESDEAEEMVDEVDMDEAEEMVDFADTLGFGNSVDALGGAMNAGQDDPQESSDENSESGSEDGSDNPVEFANVSRSPIIPYQSSFLAMDRIGPGRHGNTFEYGEASAVMSDLSHLSMIHRKNIPTFNLIRLPKSFVELYNIVSKVKGREESGATEEHEDVGNSETAICLLTGTVMRSGSPRRPYNRTVRPPGACTLHARKHGSGIGIFFLVQKCTVLLMHNNKSAYSPSIYVDEHGEEDPGLRRGRPLFLNDVRYRALELLWRHQGIPREVAQIRSTSDRVIRDNWY